MGGQSVPFVLLVSQSGRTVRFPLSEGQLTVGSAPEADVRIFHLSVSRRHALLYVSPDGVDVEDLDSSNGTRHGDQKVRARTPVAIGVPLQFGAAVACVEAYEAEDAVIGIALASEPHTSDIDTGDHRRAATTLSPTVLENFALKLLPDLLGRIAVEKDPRLLIQSVAEGLFRYLPCVSLELLREGRAGEAVVFSAIRDRPVLGKAKPCNVEPRFGNTILRVVFPQPSLAEIYRPLVRAGAALVAVCDRMAGTSLPADGDDDSPREVTPVPDPPSVSPIVRKIYADASRIAGSMVSVLIKGESGTGKEVLARFIHAASPRSSGPLVALNCAALPRDLLEAELFGVEEGVATGVESRPGRIELAHDGTLFLDEIGDMALETQARILRVLQEKEVHRIGGRKGCTADVRIVSATNRDLEEMLGDGRFRDDLYHRVADWVVDLPPLRSRPEDIPNLAAFFLGRSCEARGVNAAGISRAALLALSTYRWPGNIRQLEKEMARASVFLENGDLLDTPRLTPSIIEAEEDALPASLKKILENTERKVMRNAVSACGGDIGAAAKYLGISRSKMYRRMAALEIGD